VFWGVIHRMIFWELCKIFFLSLIGLTGLILMAGLIGEASRNGLGPTQILAAIPLLLPSLLPYTVPTTTLFATCIVYGRLSADNEILALKAAGVHIIHVIWPALILGIVTTVVTMALYVDVIPSTHFMLRSQVIGDVEELLYMMLRKDGCIKHPRITMEIYVNGVHGRKLQNVVFMRKGPGGKGFDVIARAKEAELRFEPATKRILIHMYKCEVVQAQQDKFAGIVDGQTWPVDLPPDMTDRIPTKFRASDMTWLELFEYLEDFQRERQKLSEEIDMHQAAHALGKGQPHFPEHVRHLISERKMRDHQISSVRAEFHMRPAMALGCLCFALVACPVGIWFSRSDYLSAFITCFVPIVVVYYPLMLCVINMTRSGRLPVLALYGADLILLVAGLFLFRRLART
jgi:lipopolysaccharide export system permease protein